MKVLQQEKQSAMAKMWKTNNSVEIQKRPVERFTLTK